MRISAWSSDVCSSDLVAPRVHVPAATTAQPARRLRAVQAIGYTSGGLVPGSELVRAKDAKWVDGAAEFDNVSLAYLLDRANQHAQKPITVADPSLAALRVSGRFKVGDPDRLADNIAPLFELPTDWTPNRSEKRHER